MSERRGIVLQFSVYLLYTNNVKKLVRRRKWHGIKIPDDVTYGGMFMDNFNNKFNVKLHHKNFPVIHEGQAYPIFLLEEV